ncbi:MAG: biotin--[acetyl-CoA-carboxylase] ligase [Rhodospirillales bacterium]|nr:biotin--[acetyl-CoA-carboxylase] ligase [Rhodospirillales bacterium]MCB9979985.1 biotin--[acetyl-CoA-carboxylase] ligase [Rhodospirillales bacterium]
MFKLQYYPEIDSTNLEAKRLIEAGRLKSATVLYAGYQTAGQGSRGRQWDSARVGNFAASYVFPLQKDVRQAHLAVYPIALSVYRYLGSLTPAENSLHIKWPNDILINGKKVCGCLHEIAHTETQSYFIAGIGINLFHHPNIEKNAFPATNLSEYAKISPDLENHVINLGKILQDTISFWKKEGISVILDQIKPCLYRFKEEITLFPREDRRHSITGIFENIDENGALLLKTRTDVQKFTSADIFPSLHEKPLI